LRLKGVLLRSLYLLLESLDAKLDEVGVRATGRCGGLVGLTLEEARERPCDGDVAPSSESWVVSSCKTFCLAATGREDLGNSLYRTAIRSSPGVFLYAFAHWMNKTLHF
jgi:hypothetical protein